jgi:hypothetical protein
MNQKSEKTAEMEIKWKEKQEALEPQHKETLKDQSNFQARTARHESAREGLTRIPTVEKGHRNSKASA